MTEAPALTWLYVPGDRPDRFDKALASGADRVIVDLEDAVAPTHKDEARTAIARWLATDHSPGTPPIEVRINALETPFAELDLDAVLGLPRLAGLRIPKAESPDDVARLGDRVGSLGGAVDLHLLIETARGLEAAGELARAHAAVGSIALGEADLGSELGIADDAGFAWARGRIVVAAAAAGLPPPAMSVYPALDDLAGLVASCHAGRRMGFLGRAAIHPRQLAVIEGAFLPTDAEVTEAAEIRDALARAGASGQGTAVLPGGRFVDRAMAGRADRILALAARHGTARLAD